MVSPSLTSLTLTMKGAGGLLTEKNDVIGGLLCTTANIAQGLKELHLDIEGFWLVKDMVDILISFHELEVLTLEVGSPGAFIARDLKAHPTIRKLKLNIQDFNKSITHKFKPLTYHEGDYPALEELTIVGDWYATNLTLRSIVPAPTRTLTVCSFSLPNLRRFAICLEMIVEASPRLEVLQMAVCIPEGGEDQVFRWPNYISSSALLSLTALKQLVELSLDIGVPVELDDEDAIYLISSLPKLRVCVICPGFWCERSRITPSFLGWVARNAKRITSLGLPIYMDLFWQPGFISSFSPVESSQLAPVPALQTLYLSGPMPLLSTADEIAAYLLSLFPALETIHSTSTVYDGSLFFWYEVAAALERRREPMSESSEYFDCVEDEVDGDVFGDEDEEGEWMRLGADLKAEEWIRNWGRLGV
ncbi:hypothetical protein FRC19_000108 [Serendipita sp. 401]|nr:hypothetical protein FRC19_000108 [Serendipita sp. 401]